MDMDDELTRQIERRLAAAAPTSMAEQVVRSVVAVIGPVIADYIQELHSRVDHLQRQVTLLSVKERGRAHRELVHAAESDADD
jgi:hypothetical protein